MQELHAPAAVTACMPPQQDLSPRQWPSASSSQPKAGVPKAGPPKVALRRPKAASGKPARPQLSPDVWVHIYNCDAYTGFLNRVLLTQQEIGIYHAGIEVFGEEWSFQYYEDTWNDPSVSGVMRCTPKRMPEYEYRESVNLGPTPLSQEEAHDLVMAMHDEYPACSYHLTHNNCLTFAETLATRLKAPSDFPQWLKGILEASKQNDSLDAVVDYSWSWVKWWMIRKHQPAEEECKASNSTGMVSLQRGTGGMCGGFFNFDGTCSGTLCPGNTNRSGITMSQDDVPRRAHVPQDAVVAGLGPPRPIGGAF